jgi:hypothetical protein
MFRLEQEAVIADLRKKVELSNKTHYWSLKMLIGISLVVFVYFSFYSIEGLIVMIVTF